MRAARAHAYGPPESIVIEDVSDPEPGPGQAVVAVEAAAINYPDVLILGNRYQVSAPLPLTPGSEFTGTVVAVGDGVDAVRAGDQVLGSVMTGAFAERVVVPASSLVPRPKALDAVHAAAFRVTYRTAYHALRSVGEAKEGDWVVVLAGAGGVGTAAIDVAKRLGCRVVAAAGGAEKTAVCRERGADAVIDYTIEDLKERIKEHTGGGADVVLDPVGGSASEAALRACRWGARFVSVGFASGEIPRIPLNLVLLKGVVVKGFDIRTFPEHEPELARRDEQELLDLVEAGRLQPYVSAVHPLDDVVAALRSVADRKTTGKVVITIGSGGDT
jgi:NADPH:quinone reductase